MPKTDIITQWCMHCHLFIREIDGDGVAGASHGLHKECIEPWLAKED